MSAHKVPANAIWVVIPVAAIFTIWTQIEAVIVAFCAFAMYATYGMVVSAVLWGRKQRTHQLEAGDRKPISRGLCVAALAWIASIMGLLVFMTATTISHLALVVTALGAGLLGLASARCFRLRRKNRRSADLQPAEEE